ncbi:PDR/VanB family oxidoreductase [Acinetobacter gerneri]|jgi:ferredoxin-NADP reductase|uniref:PDR/VanB family oxidoreductase n=1 Tax=Acinetobacter gerneri TaxID=202952 RepID=UPI0023F12CB1|nr:PDR/VanB family oxidoreductase [Acinetobacter gerneri]MCH4245832.1 PDR/VanB family oxidoreductase [Acinetobacter gerneri]
MEIQKLKLIIYDIRCEAKDTLVVELRDTMNNVLPAFTAGSHLEVYLKNGLIRHYSLLNDPAEDDRYVIAISLDANSKGGSQYIHQKLRVGDLLTVSTPRNNFPLVEANQYCFVAGGIGITPLLTMIHWCIAHQKKWRLYYSVRNRQRAAFYESLKALQQTQNIHFHFNDEHEHLLDLDAIVRTSTQQEHIYCCGPNQLMHTMKEVSTTIAERVHFEWFSAPGTLAQSGTSQDEISDFTVKLVKSGQEIPVRSEQSILEAIEEHGVEVPFSCRAGICRACECKVLNGEPEHLDMILSDSEKESNQSILICVSRARSKVLELDI